MKVLKKMIQKTVTSTSNKEKNIYSYALGLLSKRGYFILELKRKLLSKGFDKEGVDAALEKLVNIGYLDDMKSAEIYIRELKRKKKGLLYIKKKLMEKAGTEVANGIPVRDHYSIEEEVEAALKMSERVRSTTVLGLKSKLINRGFSSESVTKALNGKSIT